MRTAPLTNPAMVARVLVADADADTRALYREWFSCAGCDVVEAVDGRDALAKALVREPTLIVTELRLPILDGLALCEILRRDRVTATVPILVVTTETREAELERIRRAGADVVAIKPATYDNVLKHAQVLMDRPAEQLNASFGVEAVRTPLAHKADEVTRSAVRRRTVLSKSHARFSTTMPPAAPPELRCPTCDRSLAYQRSHIGGVNERQPEQWDYYTCGWCSSTFQYRQRTRKLRQVAPEDAVELSAPGKARAD